MGFATWYFAEKKESKKFTHVEKKIKQPTNLQLAEKPLQRESQEKAVAIIEKSSESTEEKPVMRFIIPKGKRLYNEAAMAEVATDANIETLRREDN